MTDHSIQCPGWGGTTPYENYRQSLILWEQVTSLSKAKRAPALILKLSGVPERMIQQHVPKIMGIRDEGDDGAMSKRVKRLVELLDAEYREDPEDVAYKNVIAFMHIKRVEADMCAYVSRFNTAREAAFGSLSGERPMSDEILSAHLLNTSALSAADRKLIMGSVGGKLSDLKNIQHNLKRIVVSSHPTHSGESVGKQVAHCSFLASEGEGDSASSDEDGVQTAYASYLSKKQKFDQKYNKTHPNSNTPQKSNPPLKIPGVAMDGKNPISRTTGKRMKCYICGSLDHLIPQCPKKNESNLVEQEILFTQRNTNCVQDHFFIVDTGATSSIASVLWFREHCEWLMSLGKKPGHLDKELRTSFRFGNGATKMSLGVATVQVCLGGKWLTLKCHIFDCRCPQLLSRHGLANLKAVLDVDKKEIFFRSINTAIHMPQSDNGHFLLNLRDSNGPLENEDPLEPLPTILNVVEDFCDFLGGSEAVPTLDEICQAEPREGALCDNSSVIPPDSPPSQPFGTEAEVSSSAIPSPSDALGSSSDVGNGSDLEQNNPTDQENKHPISLCSTTADCSGVENFVSVLDNALSAVSLRQIKQTSGPMLAEGLKKIHALWGHPSAAQLKKSLSHIDGLPSETNRIVERITKECSTCNKFLEAPTLPVGGTRSTLHFNHTLEIDLFFLDEWIFLSIVDVHTLWTRVVPIVSKKTEVVFKALLDHWFQVFSPPRYITLDSGGEFFSDFWSEQLTNMGITPNYRPRGSHAFVVEERNRLLKDTLLKIRDSHPDWSLDLVLVHVMRVLNNLIGKSGFSPCQTLFGTGQSDFIAGLCEDQDERNNDLFQNLDIGSPFLTALKIREVAQAALHSTLNENRLNRMLRHQNQYKQVTVRVGDTVSFFKNSIKKSDARWYGPAQVLFIQDCHAFVLYAGRVSHVPLHFLKVYIPENTKSSAPDDCEKSRSSFLVPPNFQDAIETDPLPAELEESPLREVKVETSEPSAVDSHVAPVKNEQRDDVSSTSEISSLNDSTPSQAMGSPEDLSGLKWEELHERAKQLDPPFRKRATRDKLIDVLQERSKKQKLAHADFLQKRFLSDKEYIKSFEGLMPSDLVQTVNFCSEFQNENDGVITAFLVDSLSYVGGSTLTLDEELQFAPQLRKAKESELASFAHHDAVTVVDKKLATYEPISMRWVITWKDSPKSFPGLPSNKIIKARLVARGFEDPEVKNKTLINSALMAGRGSNLLLLSLAALRKWTVEQMDVSGAFLKSDPIQRLVWLQPPVEANLRHSKIWRANKAVYGLADGPSYFFKTLDRFLREDEVWSTQAGFIFQPTEVDPCLYKITEYHSSGVSDGDSSPGKVIGLMTTHVDDILLAGTSDVVHLVGRILDVRFETLKHRRLTPTVPLKHCGMQIELTPEGIVLNQRAYTLSIDALPYNKHSDPKGIVSERELDGVRMRLGQLTYITYASRPDISARVGELAAVINQFTYEHVALLNNVIEHVRGTCSETRLVFSGGMCLDTIHLVLFVDGALGGSDCHSRIGTLLSVTDKFPSGLSHLVGWESKRLRRVARSSLAAEIHAANEQTDYAHLVRNLYQDVLTGSVPLILATDCQSLFSHVRTNKTMTERALQKPFFQLQEMLNNNTIQNVVLLSGSDNPADALTKAKRASTLSIDTLMRTGTLPRISPFTWLKNKKRSSSLSSGG